MGKGYWVWGTWVRSREEERRAGNTAALAPAGQAGWTAAASQALLPAACSSPRVSRYICSWREVCPVLLQFCTDPEPCRGSPAPKSSPSETCYSFPRPFYVACLCPQKELCPVCLFPFSAGLATSEKAQMNDEFNTPLSALLGWGGTRASAETTVAFESVVAFVTCCW